MRVVSSADRHRRRVIGEFSSANRHRKIVIGKLSSASCQRQIVVERLSSVSSHRANRYRGIVIGRLSLKDCHRRVVLGKSSSASRHRQVVSASTSSPRDDSSRVPANDSSCSFAPAGIVTGCPKPSRRCPGRSSDDRFASDSSGTTAGHVCSIVPDGSSRAVRDRGHNPR